MVKSTGNLLSANGDETVKIRMDFTANSSSTSFIVAFDREISKHDTWSVRDMVKDLLDVTRLRKDLSNDEYADDSGISLWDIYHAIIEALANELIECISNGKRVVELEDMRCLWRDEWHTPTGCVKDVSEFDTFFEANSGQYIYYFDVSDETSIGHILERCYLLKTFPGMSLWCH